MAYPRFFKIDSNGELSYFYDGSFNKISSVTPTANKSPVLESHKYLPVHVISGDYGGNFTNGVSLTDPDDGQSCIVIVHDTNAGGTASRLYVYDGSAWKYVDLS